MNAQSSRALLYLVSGILFILALRGLSSPATSRQGNRFGMIGMAIAIVDHAGAISCRRASRAGCSSSSASPSAAASARWRARIVPMTAMPQLVAVFHSLVGLAAVLRGGRRALCAAGFRHRRRAARSTAQASSRCRSASPSAQSPSPARSSPSSSSTGACRASRSCCRSAMSINIVLARSLLVLLIVALRHRRRARCCSG